MAGQRTVEEKLFINLMKGLKSAYTAPNFLPDDKSVQVWYAMLKDIPQDVLNVAVQRHIMTSKYPPTIAELREACAEISMENIDDWTKAWSNVLDVVSKYGIANGVEGFKQLDSVTQEAVKRVGYWDICNSENIAIERASFRAAYEQIVARKKSEAIISGKVIAQIEEARKKSLENLNFIVDKKINSDIIGDR